jgi:hypothetical protein
MHLIRALWSGLRQCANTGVARCAFIAESRGECKEKMKILPLINTDCTDRPRIRHGGQVNAKDANTKSSYWQLALGTWLDQH